MPLPYAIRIPLRSLRRSPMLFGSAIFAIAMGVAAPTTMFTVAAGALRDLPVPQPELLVYVDVADPRDSFGMLQMDGRWFAALRDRQTTLEDVAAYTMQLYDVSGFDALPEQRNAARVTANTFGLLRVEPYRGRDFTAADAVPGAEPVVLVSHDFWQARLAGDDAVVGERIRLNGEPHTIIGVMPPGFAFPERQQLWTVFEPTISDASWPMVDVFGRRAADVALARVNAELASITPAVAALQSDWPEGAAYAAMPYSESMIETADRMILAVMTLLFALVLIIACVNVANLLIARAIARTQEVAVRAALGAGGRRLALEQLSEALLIALPGAVAGLILSRFGVAAFARQLEPFLPFWVSFQLEAGVLLFTLGCLLLATLSAGMLPALRRAS
ncbi:MAG: ABC transporter permease [Gemmatimonadota bacterium]